MTDRRLLLVLSALMVLVVVYAAACTGSSKKPKAGRSGSPGGPQTAVVPGSPMPSASQTVSPSGPAPSGRPSGAPGAPAGWWRPGLGLTWQWQLTGAVDTSVKVDVYDLDAFTTPAATVAGLHAAGRRTICYVNVGAREDFRPDAAQFPPAVVGKGLAGWPGENWLDIRRWDLLEPILTARFNTCRGKGFDAVEPDNADGFTNQSGFALTASDQLTYNRRVADLAHRLGLGVGLKNDVEQAPALAPAFDFAVNEECAKYRECGQLSVFVAAGKPVFHVEYELGTDQFCPSARALGFSSMRKKLDLDAWRQPC